MVTYSFYARTAILLNLLHDKSYQHLCPAAILFSCYAPALAGEQNWSGDSVHSVRLRCTGVRRRTENEKCTPTQMPRMVVTFFDVFGAHANPGTVERS